MFVHFLRHHSVASYLLTLFRLYLGVQWLTAGWGKIKDGFDASGFLFGALKKSTGEHPEVQSWWAGFLKNFAIPHVEMFNILVPWGEFLVGLGLLLGTFTALAALMGAVMNFSYLLSGSSSTNPEMVLLEVLLLVAGFNASKIGLDRWIIPFLRKKLFSKKSNETSLKQAA